jgi:hypothetical protein
MGITTLLPNYQLKGTVHPLVLADLRLCSPFLFTLITLITYLYSYTRACLALAWPALP